MNATVRNSLTKELQKDQFITGLNGGESATRLEVVSIASSTGRLRPILMTNSRIGRMGQSSNFMELRFWVQLQSFKNSLAKDGDLKYFAYSVGEKNWSH